MTAKILVTGASGNLGRGVAERLQHSYDVTLSDVAPFDTTLPFEAADARSLADLRRVIRPGYDLLVHTAAWHGVHSRQHPATDYWQLNVDGTYNALTAAVEAGITRVVWASSAVFYGPLRDKYSFSKQIGEQVLDHFREAHGVQSVRLRYTNFTPYSDFSAYGLRLLGGGGLDRRDAALATVRAVDALLTGEVGDDWFDVTTVSPFSDEQAARWAADPWSVLDEVFPADGALLRRHLATLPARIGTERAEKLTQKLGYTPQYTFATFVEELRERDRTGDLSAPDGYSVYSG
ncbi:MAG: NAD-dependent epimerase/dehydratase family protein [Roseiflexaceae bacterium]|nr:NAD-dependent epimerase/dehydratase family protein [Roseiflexaceae bacterium]